MRPGHISFITSKIPEISCRGPLYLTLLIAGLLTAITIRNGSYTPWATDSGSYINAARRWAEADLFSPDALQLWPRWTQLGVPLGHTPAAIRGTYVTGYPLGFPILLAAGDLVDRDLGVYVVTPLFAGLLVIATFFLARYVTTAAPAVLASALVALSPIVIGHSVTPMSDVPATALFILALVMSLRASLMAALAGGLALALAVMTRPILAPLGIVPFALILVRNWRHAVIFALAAAAGPALVAWSQLLLYGSPLKTGYIGFEGFFSRDRIGVNAEVYVRNLVALYSPFVFLGLAASVPLYFTRDERSRRPFVVMVALIVMIVINYALYLPYMTYDDIWSTRFLLPAQVALFILLAATTRDAIVAVSRLSRVLAVVCIVPVAIVTYECSKLFPFLMAGWPGQSQTRLMAHYLRDALPPNAALITFLHGGAFALTTGAQIVRFDLMSPADAEELIDALQRRGYEPVVVIDAANEWATYVMALKGTKYETLDWPERALSVGFTQMWYVALSDRTRPRDQLPPTDVLRD